jgi:hypothetical protein
MDLPLPNMNGVLFFKWLMVAWLLAGSVCAQTPDFTPDFSRSLFHSRLDNAQSALLAMDGTSDSLLRIYEHPEINDQLTYLLTRKIDGWQRKVEESTLYDHNRKLTYLRGMTELLNGYKTLLQASQADWSHLNGLVSGFMEALTLQESDLSIEPIIQHQPYALARMMIGNFAFAGNQELGKLNELVFLKYIRQYPHLTLKKLNENTNYACTDSIINAMARKRPEELITYAQAWSSPLGKRINASREPLVKTIVELANDPSGQLYFPFLDLLSSGDLSRADIQEALTDSARYYSLLVKTQIAYAGRMARGDTPVVTRGLQDMLHRKSLEIYVNTVNGLHDLPNPVRFKKIQPLSPQELYYLIVLNEVEIYTSSYIYIYQRMFELMPSKNADSLLGLVNFDKYKKFLTMASNYNTLNDFLGKMSGPKAEWLMADFVSNLDRGADYEDIEDAVDVANAYGSITQPSIRNLMLNKVKDNLAMATQANNRRGMVIYRLEKVIMESSDVQIDTTKPKVNISDSLGIPPVYQIRNDQLRDAKGRIVLQMYFYGDAAGKGTFNHLMRLYGDRTKWAMTSTPQWVQFTSKGSEVPFVLFANRALDEENDEDTKATEALISWMHENDYRPAISVHRGHSYYLPYTIEKLQPSKVVVLGSCGAYHNLADILRISPDAYIISSKQVGYGEINVALFTYLVDKLKAGKDVAWPVMMQEVAGKISAQKREGYDDYIFPHQNLGAMFIKAYKMAMSTEAGALSFN